MPQPLLRTLCLVSLVAALYYTAQAAPKHLPHPHHATKPQPATDWKIDDAVMKAASEGDVATLRLLVAHGAGVNFINNSMPLVEAAAGGHLEAVKFLLAHGADVNGVNNIGNSGLHLAEAALMAKGDPVMRWKYAEIIAVLKKAGAKEDVNAKPPLPLSRPARSDTPLTYALQNLGVPDNQGMALGVSIDAGGRIAVNCEIEIGTPTTYWWKEGQWHSLGVGTTASQIDDRGRIVGARKGFPTANASYAAVWDRGVMTRLPDPPGPVHFSEATAGNRRGQIVGRALFGDAYTGALWERGRVRRLDPPGGLGFVPCGLNDRGEIAGTGGVKRGGSRAFLRAFLWQPAAGKGRGRWVNLGALGGDGSEAEAINSRGQVIGRAQTAGGVWHAFLYSGGKMTDLGVLAGDDSSCATGLNDRGQVIGTSEPNIVYLHQHGPRTRSFLWQNGVMYALSDLLPADSKPRFSTEVYQAWGINDAGLITGANNYQVFLLTPAKPGSGTVSVPAK